MIVLMRRMLLVDFFFFNDTATTEIYTLSLHDALPISRDGGVEELAGEQPALLGRQQDGDVLGLAALALVDRHRVHRLHLAQDRKSTRLNSSHANISYAVFCLKKKKNTKSHMTNPST